MSNKIQMPKPLTPEEKRQQAARLIAQKYEALLTGLLFNMCHNPAFDPTDETQAHAMVQTARKMTDEVMDTLYRTPEENQAANQ